MRTPGVVYKIGKIYDKTCKHCGQSHKVEVFQRLRGNGKFENRLVVVGDGRQFQGRWCPNCTTPQKRGEMAYKPEVPKTPSLKCPTPAAWCSRGQARRITKYLRRYHPNTTITPKVVLGANGLTVANWIESQFHDNPITGEKMRWEDAGIKWEIDHKIELGRFDKTDMTQLMKGCHYTNLQPMWKDAHKQKNKEYYLEKVTADKG